MLKISGNESTTGAGVIIKAALLFTGVTALCVIAFAALSCLFPALLAYSVLLATASAALGAFATAFYLSLRAGSKGWLCGLVTGASVFTVLTLASLFINHGGFSSNTLFRLIIIMLSAEIGGIAGVNRRQNKKYI